MLKVFGKLLTDTLSEKKLNCMYIYVPNCCNKVLRSNISIQVYAVVSIKCRKYSRVLELEDVNS